jgi:hypothetical protein
VRATKKACVRETPGERGSRWERFQVREVPGERMPARIGSTAGVRSWEGAHEVKIEKVTTRWGDW